MVLIPSIDVNFETGGGSMSMVNSSRRRVMLVCHYTETNERQKHVVLQESRKLDLT